MSDIDDIEESSEDDFDSTVFHKFLDYFKQQISFFKLATFFLNSPRWNLKSGVLINDFV